MVATRRLDVDPGDIPIISGQILPGPVAEELEPEVLRTIETFYDMALDDLGVSGAFNVVDPRVVGYLTELGAERIPGINETTRSSIATELAKGVQAGEGSEALARRVEGVFEFADRVRARRIARTEVNGASNFGRHTAFADSGIVRRKEWSAVRDSRTRVNHLRLHGQRVDMAKPFRIPGTTRFAMYPGGFSVVGENVNCRCVVLPVVDRANRNNNLDESRFIFFNKDQDVVDVSPEFDEAWEREVDNVEEGMRRAFARQRDAVLAALERVG